MTKISDLTALTGAGVDDAADLLPIVDMSETGAARNKKITIDEARIALGLSSADSPQFTALNLGHASDTTITRASAGVIAVEGVNVVTTAGGVTFAADISVPDEAYDATAWNGSVEVPTKNAVRDKIEALAGGGFTAASTTEVLTGTDSSKGVTPDALAALWEQGSDVASAATVSLGEGGYFNITGTTTITDIDFATDKAGRTAWVKFAGALTLTHNASTLILPTGANITTAAGDTACFVSEGTDAVRCVAYTRASGAALASTGGGWVELLNYDFASGASSTKECDVTGYKEILIIGNGLVHAASVQRNIQVSIDGGSNWYTSSGNYSDVAATGVLTSNAAIFGHNTSNASARNILVHITDNDGRSPVNIACITRAAQQIFSASATAINRIRLMGSAAGSGTPDAGNFTAGTIRVRGRT